MKFIHCSDIHLGRRPVGGIGEYSEKRFNDYFNAFNKVVDITIEKEVDALLIAGDLFDKRELSPDILYKTETILHRLKENNIPVVVIEGNHDNITNDNEGGSWIGYLETKELILRPYYTVFRDEKDDCIKYEFTPVSINGKEIYGLGYPGSLVDDVLCAFNEYLKENKKTEVIALVHTAPAGGSDFLPGVVKFDTVKELQGQVEYLACGHFHSYSVYPKTEPILFIPGATEYWDLGEVAREDRRGVIFYDTDSKEHSLLDIEQRKSVVFTLEINKNSDTYEKFREQYSTKNIDEETLVVVKLVGNGTKGVDSGKLSEIADEIAPPLKLYPLIKVETNGIDGNMRKKGESIESVEKRIIENWEQFGEYSLEVITTLETLKNEANSKQLALFNDSFDALLTHIIEGE